MPYSLLAGSLLEVAVKDEYLSSAVGVGAELLQRLRVLNAKERYAWDSIEGLAASGGIYESWLEQNAVINSLVGIMTLQEAKALLANMATKGVLDEAAGLWKAVY